jgi:hypothetical protein
VAGTRVEPVGRIFCRLRVVCFVAFLFAASLDAIEAALGGINGVGFKSTENVKGEVGTLCCVVRCTELFAGCRIDLCCLRGLCSL